MMPRGEVHQSWGMLQDAPSKASMTCPGTLRAGSPSWSSSCPKQGTLALLGNASLAHFGLMVPPCIGSSFPLGCASALSVRGGLKLYPLNEINIYNGSFSRNWFKYSNLLPFYPPITRFVLFILMMNQSIPQNS